MIGSIAKGHGRAPNPPKRRCVYCKNREIPPGNLFYCSKKCRFRAQKKRDRASRKRRGIKEKSYSRKREDRIRPRGRVCKWCQCRDDETTFESEEQCEACEMRKRRMGVCKTHNLLLYKDGVCFECTPPFDAIKCLLLDGSSERQRYVWRKVWRGCVCLGKRWKVIDRWPPEFVLTPDQFVMCKT